MSQHKFSEDELALVETYFDIPLERLTEDYYREHRRELMKKYHPDKIAYIKDEERTAEHERIFKELREICIKIELYLKLLHEHEHFSYTDMKVEIITTNKDLKYFLFGTEYRWLQRGEKFKIKNTNAFITMDEDHEGKSIGFLECIRMYVTFSENDSLESIVLWLYIRILNNAEYLIIHGTKIEIDFEKILNEMKKLSFHRIEKQ